MSALSKIEKLSELLTMALDDYEKVKANPKFKINMSTWYSKIDNVCNACIAGSLIARRIKPRLTKKDNNSHPADFDHKTECLLIAIEEFRKADFDQVFYNFFLAFHFERDDRVEDRRRHYGHQIAELEKKYKYSEHSWDSEYPEVKRMRLAIEDIKTMGL